MLARFFFHLFIAIYVCLSFCLFFCSSLFFSDRAVCVYFFFLENDNRINYELRLKDHGEKIDEEERDNLGSVENTCIINL